MTAVAVRPEVAYEQPVCDLCGALPPRNRGWGRSLPKKFPATLTPEHIDETLAIHPWLRGTRLAALAEILRDVEVSNV